MDYDVIVVGAGIAGIAVAIRLKKQGKSVVVLEKNPYVGGKIYQHNIKGYTWDTGPSLFTMPQLVDDLYDLCESNPRAFYAYHKQDESCRYFFADGVQVTFFTEMSRLQKELKEKLNIDDTRVATYLESSRNKYDSIGKLFLENPIHKVSKLPFGKIIRMFSSLMKTNLFDSLHQVNTKKLKDSKLVQIFDRYATYNGSNPFKASGVLSMIPHLEQNIGTFFPVDGMRSIVTGLYNLALQQGVVFKFGQNVETCKFENGKYNIKTQNVDLSSCRMVSAIDCVSFYDNLLKDKELSKRFAKQERSSSAIIFYWGIKKQFPKLGLHNIFFSEDYKDEFKLIFEDKTIPFEGTIYVHISSKVNQRDAPDCCENWFVMLNLPAGVILGNAIIKKIKSTILTRLERILDDTLEEYIEVEKIWTPEGISLDTGAYMGALYGAASNEKISALKRHPNFSRKYKGLYFCGGTVHPGGGIPLSLQSAQIVDKLIADEG